MLKSYFTTWKKAFQFQGRSTRRDYWVFQLISFLVGVLSYVFVVLSNYFSYLKNIETGDELTLGIVRLLSLIITLLGFIPTLILGGSIWVGLPLTVRRIRDVGMKWQWIFFAYFPYIGTVIFALIFLTRPSVEEINGKKYFPKY